MRMSTTFWNIKKIDAHKRISIPIEIMKQMGIRKDDFLKVEIKDGTIVLRPVKLEVIE